MNLLDAVNYALPYMGEATVTSVDVRHPTVALIVRAINDHSRSLQAGTWWFNDKLVKLYPDADKLIATPANLITIVAVENKYLVENRNNRLYDLTNDTYMFTEMIECRLKEELPFEELPHWAAEVIKQRATRQVYVQDYGIESTIKELAAKETEATNQLMHEHLRKRKFSTTKSRRVGRFMHALRA
jgi:hypothetical protein